MGETFGSSNASRGAPIDLNHIQYGLVVDHGRQPLGAQLV